MAADQDWIVRQQVGHLYFVLALLSNCTQLRFASLLSGGFTTLALIDPLEKKLANCISVNWCSTDFRGKIPSICPLFECLGYHQILNGFYYGQP